MGEDKQKAIIALLIINVILIGYFGISFTKKLSTQNDILASRIDNVGNSVAYLDSNISGIIQNVLDSRDNKVDTTEYKYTDIDTKNNKVALDVTVNLKHVNSNSRIYLAYTEIDVGNIKEVELTKKEGLSYGSNIELDLDKNYQYDVIEKVDGGGEALLNIQKEYIYLYNEFYETRVQQDSASLSRSDEEIGFDVSFFVVDFGMDELGLDKAQLEVWYEDRAIDAIDITDSIVSNEKSGLIEPYNIALASGEIDPDMSMKEFGRAIGYKSEDKNDTRAYYTYTHRIDNATDYLDLELDWKKAESLRFKLIITCKDGYQYEVY